jgi:hypothetical protein
VHTPPSPTPVRRLAGVEVGRLVIRPALIACLLALAAPALGEVPPAGRAASATVDLGDGAVLAQLLAYPNNRRRESLARTAEHYLRQSLSRDGLDDASVRVDAAGGHYYARLTQVPPAYPEQISRFLKAGAAGLAARQKLRRDGKWNARRWRLFLPLGLALQNPRAVQLLHFPPDTSMRRQDYLGSKSSRRWETLLELNGVSPADVAQYERIVDIAPVAAPADAGDALAQTYPYFRDYAYGMLRDSVSPPSARLPLPVVAQGGPARAWAKKYLGARLRVSAAPARVRVGDVARVPFLGANHPSLLWHVAHKSRIAALRVMRDDLIAACWQVRMSENPGRDIDDALAACAHDWDRREAEVCEQTEIQGYDTTPEAARRACARSAARLMKRARPAHRRPAAHRARKERLQPGVLTARYFEARLFRCWR